MSGKPYPEGVAEVRAVLQLPVIVGAQSIMNADTPTSSIWTLTAPRPSGETP